VTVVYAIAHIGGVLVEPTLLPLGSRVGLSRRGRESGNYGQEASQVPGGR